MMRPGEIKAGWLGVRWGALYSALLHLGIAALILLVLTEPKKPEVQPRKVPVEIVRPLEKKPEKKKPAKKVARQAKKTPSTAVKTKPVPTPKEQKKEAKAKPPEKPVPPATQKPLLAKKAKPKPPETKPPEPKKVEPRKEEPKVAEPVKEPPRVAEAKEPRPPRQKTQPKAAERQLADKHVKPKPKGGSRKVKPNPDSDTRFSMVQRKLVGRWVLQPLKVNLRHRCGSAALSGVIDLTKKRGDRFFGTLRTTIRWALCPPEGTVNQIVLVIRGNRVVMRDAGGVLDSGLIQGDVMVLQDAYGRSVWRRGR